MNQSGNKLDLIKVANFEVTGKLSCVFVKRHLPQLDNHVEIWTLEREREGRFIARQVVNKVIKDYINNKLDFSL